MAPARPASSVARNARYSGTPRAHPRRVAMRGPISRVRWDRMGRIGMLVVLAVVGALYFQHALSYLSTRSQATQQSAIVQRLVRENAALVRERKSLSDPATIERDARALGMVKPGERPYVVMDPSSSSGP
ncbi:MAG: FtsB family cell division protein [Solirubrobacteraceae bacterium]